MLQTQTKGKHSEASVLFSLSKKNDVRIKGNTIITLNDKSKIKHNDLGNSSWGKIDYLKKQLKYKHVILSDFSTVQQLN